MGMSTDCYYGFGFGADKFDDKKVVELCKNHKKTLEDMGEDELIKEIEENENFDFEDYEVEPFNGYSYRDAVNVLANIMSTETKIQFSVMQDKDGFIYIMFNPQEPWLYNNTEKNLTSEKLLEIYQKYAEELGFEYKDLEYLKIVMFG